MHKRYVSPITKRYKAASTVFFWISALLIVVPLVVFGFMAITAELAWYCWLMFALGILMFVVDLIRHSKNRISVWLVLLGLALCVEPARILILIAVTTVCVFLDEYVVWPIHQAFKRKARINREIDRRP